MGFRHLRSFHNCFWGLPYWILIPLTEAIA
nr:MAG TPA: hypothetical protein [Caudoviricetes sp.]